jgi:hypothetical protein
VCGQPRGGQSSSPWGANLHTFALPAITAAPDSFNGTPSMPMRSAINHDYAHPQARNTNCKRCGSNAPNDNYNASTHSCPGGQYGPIDYVPVFGGFDPSNTSRTTIDWVDSAVWIHGPNKQGALFLGQLAETISTANGFSENRTYGPIDPYNCHARYGTATCCHGHFSPTDAAVGPCADTLISYGWIYNEADLVRILNGSLTAYGATPASTFRLHSIAPSGIAEERSANYQTAGVWFDEATNRLYICEAHRIFENYAPRPVVHVFAVNC